MRSQEGPLALEVTEYHPQAENCPRAQRSEIEGRWRCQLAALLNRAKKNYPFCRDIVIKLGFTDPRLPRKEHHASLVDELFRLIRALVAQPVPSERPQKIGFTSALIPQCIPPFEREWISLGKDSWPICSQHLRWLSIQRMPGIGNCPISCPDLDGAWCSVTDSEVKRILETKVAKARNYDTGGHPLWLLIVCELPRDLQSHVFPLDGQDYREWIDALSRIPFDLASSPFSEVWLMSASTRSSVRLCPLDDRIAL
jgi:hypothetical protein